MMNRSWLPRLVAPAAIVMVAAAACSGGPSPAAQSGQASPAATSAPDYGETTAAATETKPASVPEQAPAAAGQSPTDKSLEEELKRAPFHPGEWRTNFARRSVKLNDFLGGGPPKDGIPSIDSPKFASVKEADKWLEDPEAVEVVDIKGDVRAYPQQVLIWHEIVNDVVGGEPVAVTY